MGDPILKRIDLLLKALHQRVALPILLVPQKQLGVDELEKAEVESFMEDLILSQQPVSAEPSKTHILEVPQLTACFRSQIFHDCNLLGEPLDFRGGR